MEDLERFRAKTAMPGATPAWGTVPGILTYQLCLIF